MSNNNNPQQEDNIWPPAPSLLPPKTPELKPLLIRIPLWLVVCIDVGVSIFLSSFAYLRLSMGHHAIHWADIATEGLIPGMAIFVAHLWLRSVFLKRNPK